jgi:hypothetical protein
MTTRTLAHRVDVPIMVSVPDDPDSIKLIRVIMFLLNFVWENRQEVLLLVENINRTYDLIDAVWSVCLDMVEMILDGCQWCYEVSVCSLKYA